MYDIGDPNKFSTIAVLCRGGSLGYTKKVADLFDFCYLVGQFNESGQKLHKIIEDKKVVSVMNKSAIRTSSVVCNMLGITDVQTTLGGWRERELEGKRKQLFEKMIRLNKWLKFHEAPPGLRESRPILDGGPIGWATTGIFTVDLACFWKPKNVVILGLDFYYSDYFSREKAHSSIEKNKKNQSNKMIKEFMAIVSQRNKINFTIFTKFTGLEQTPKNLKVVNI
jgi:hypothetical protein